MPLVTRNTGAGNIYVDSTQPSDVTLGTIWIDTSTPTAPLIKASNGTNYLPAEMQFNKNAASGYAGLSSASKLTLAQYLTGVLSLG